MRLACSTPRDERFTSSAQFPGVRRPIPSRMSTCVWRNKITLPPCFNAAQTCSSSASACPVESVSKNNRQRSKEAVRLVEWVSMGHLELLLSLPHKYVRYRPKADMGVCTAHVCFWV